MRILVAGASGAIGRRLVPMLVERGHEVIGTTRRAESVVAAMGATPLRLDALDGRAVEVAMSEVKPEVVIHELTAIGALSLRDFDHSFADTNRLRVRGTDNLLAGARAAGVRRFLAQSYTSWNNPRTGGPVKTEVDGLDPSPTVHSRQSIEAMRHLESVVTSAAPIEGVVLRYGNLYGPGNALGAGGDLVRMVRRRQLPLVGGGGGIWSFVHVDDAARATVLAAEGDVVGVFNIVDDDPAPVREWLPALARAVGAKPPWRLPAWLARPLIGEHGVSIMTQVRGSSNAKARRELGWTPEYASWRDGFRTGLG